MDEKQVDLVKQLAKKYRESGQKPKLRNAGETSTPDSSPGIDDTKIQGSGHGGGSGLLEWLKSLPPGSKIVSIKIPDHTQRTESMEPRPTMPNAQNVLKPETLVAIVKLGNHAQVVAERWTSGWKKQTLAMESDGSILERIKDQAENEAEALSTAKMGGENNHLAQHEIMEMYDLKPGP